MRGQAISCVKSGIKIAKKYREGITYYASWAESVNKTIQYIRTLVLLIFWVQGYHSKNST